MSLPSQSSRNATRSSQVHYRRSRKNPLGRLIAAIAILALVFGLWYLFIRPNAAATPEETDPGEQIASNTANTPQLGNEDRPTRALPGSTPAPDPNAEVDRLIGNNTNPRNNSGNNTPTQPVEITNRTPSNSNSGSNTPANTDILDAASKQAQTTQGGPIESQTSSGSNPASRPQVEDRNTTLRGVQIQLDTARRLISQNDRVGARALLSRTLINANLSTAERQLLRDELTTLNNQLVFSPTVDANDPMCETYKIQSGDSLSRIAARRELATHWKFIQRVNRISDPAKIQLGQNIKLVRGPFHAIVDKSDHRIDIYHGAPADPASWLFIRSFDVGLGEADGTPVGEFVVSANKLENPGWVNPRNAREQYAPNDPNNPIGEYWIGLTGVGDSAAHTSYGIHGTIEPDSIGSDQSMGCVRLANGDIDIVYEMLAEHISRVLIVP